MARSLPQCVDTVIIGNGPSALILSYILHGHLPHYIGGHYDSILDAKLSKDPNLLHLTSDLYAHFIASLRYSTQALPVNTLLDTLIRPNADTEINPKSCIEWRYEPNKAVSHVAIGDTEQVGGQWADNPVSASADIGTLSYAEQLSLPGYSYADHLGQVKKAGECDFVRPTRTEYADYLRNYPNAVGISESIFSGIKAHDVCRVSDGFIIGSLGIHCKHLVLASGIFTVNIPPPPLLAPIAGLHSREAPLLVIGSGFSAADVIISASPSRRIIHVYQWAPDRRPSPLRGCHRSAYPEYATVYRQMKLAALALNKNRATRTPFARRKSANNSFLGQRDWALYEGLPNADIIDVSSISSTGTTNMTVRLASGEAKTYEVGGLEYVVGRRGTLDFLSSTLQAEILSPTPLSSTASTQISGRSLRAKAECSLEVARNVFITGSLTGDSLIRHAVGGCVFAAGRILGVIPPTFTPDSPTTSTRSRASSTPRSASPTSESKSESSGSGFTTPGELTNGHADLHLDRRQLQLQSFLLLSGWDSSGIPAIRPSEIAKKHLEGLGHMPDPSDTSHLPGFVPPSSDQAATYPPEAYGDHNAPEGNAYAQGGYATPNHALYQNVPLIYPPKRPHQPQQGLLGPIPSYYSFDPCAQPTWGWAQSSDFTQLPAPYEPQGELIQELLDRENPANDFSSSLLVDPLAPPPRPLPQRPAGSPTMKRKSDAGLQTMGQQVVNEQGISTKRRAVSRASSTASQSPAPTVLAEAQPSPIAATANQSSIQNTSEGQRRKNTNRGTGPQGREIDVSEPRRVAESTGSGDMLPAGRVFPIQIGSALFRLSGASICSDAPSYFSHFFSEQLHNNGGRANDVRTLYIDRDPETFRDIALHLQGYHIVPRDGEHFVKLFADAQFYSLPRLTKQLFKSDIFISVGGTPFRIPRDSFSAPGDSPNYFSLGFAQWFSTPSEVFPGLDRNALLRPPSISPPSVPNKSGEIFGELVKMLQGYEVDITNEAHRANLLRDARYFHLKGLEQRLVPCQKSYNLSKGQNEILIRLEDIRQSGVSFAPDGTDSSSDSPLLPGYVSYARPYTDDATSNSILILETSSSESATLHLAPLSPIPSEHVNAHVTFHGDTLRRMTSLMKIIASKIGLPSTQTLGLTQTDPSNPLVTPTTPGTSETRVGVHVQSESALTIDNQETDLESHVKSFMSANNTGVPEWVVRRAHWRIRVEPVDGEEEGQMQAILEIVKIEAFTKARSRNATRGFLGAT
ncbi:hypothetical protein OPT61_g2681 [Boeremia exigua]|uniref:Uncharacterized protein n=1 Tax=Boeremia exigua TaxID=749465 RepID=A0ACC2IKX3_9PLEO|nr:hypothetical protein OPT61_g2681 [Boeremia exigua]